MSENKPKGIEVGPPIYIESCMNEKEYRIIKSKYNTLSGRYLSYVDPQELGYKWRFGMGNSLTAVETDNINSNIDYLIKHHKP